MSDFENRLRTLAEGEAWRVPSLGNVTIALNQLRALMDRISTETGLTGQTDAAAAAELQEAKGQVQSLIDYLETDLPDAITAANEVRQEAQARLESLGAGSLNAEQQQLIRSAAAGTTVFLGPFSIVAGEGAIAGANWFMGSQREGQAETAFYEVTQQMNIASANIPEPPPLALSQDVPPPPPPQPDPIRGPIGGPVGGGPGGQGVPTYPGGSGVPGGGSGTGVGSIPPYPVIPGSPAPGFPPITGPGPVTALPQPGTIILNPDGPMDGGVPTAPGGIGTLPGGGLGGGGGAGSGGLGGGLGGGVSSGLVAGGAGAALGGLGKAAAGGGLGRLGGAGGLGGLGGAGGAGGAGGLRAGGLGGGLTANAGGGAAGGLLGKGGTGGVGVGAAGEAGGSRGPTAMMGGGGGAPAGGGGRNEKKGRGLGGPVAPKLEDDADFGPRSENAGSGGRDE